MACVKMKIDVNGVPLKVPIICYHHGQIQFPVIAGPDPLPDPIEYGGKAAEWSKNIGAIGMLMVASEMAQGGFAEHLKSALTGALSQVAKELPKGISIEVD